MKTAYHKIAFGLGTVLFGLMLPHFFQARHLGILANVTNSIVSEDIGLLLIASVKLVFLNTIRAVPIYTGTFLMAEGVYILFQSRLLGFIISLVIIPLVYKLIALIYGISYDFGSPAYLTILAILVLHITTVQIKPIFIKIVIVTMFLFGVQWLDITPFLSIYNFGRGDLSLIVKRVALFLNGESILNFISLTFSVIISFNALILARVAIQYYNRLILIEERKSNEERLRQMEVEAVKSRYFKELKNLVHDLKTPLVTILGLSEVIRMKVGGEKIKEYCWRIANSSEKMNKMISEILNDNERREIPIKELFNFVAAQLSALEMEEKIKYKPLPDIKIYGNKIRISRAIINLINNSLNAVESDDGFIEVEVFKESDAVHIIIRDNGVGIEEEMKDKIWEVGFSSKKGHSGLGLNFVKQIVEEHYGEIFIKSESGKGTAARIILPEVHHDNL